MNPKDLAQRFIDALHALEQGDASDVDGLVELFSSEARLTNAALALMGEERRGHESLRRFWTEYKDELGQCFSTFHHVTSDARAAGLFWTTEGQSHSSQSVKYDGVSLLEFDDDGKIAFFRGYYDTRDLTIKAE